MPVSDGGTPDDFPIPDELHPVLDEVHTFIEDEILPFEEAHADHVGGPLAYLDDQGRMTEEAHELQAEIRRRAGNAGLYALHMPESVGGGGLSSLEHFYVQEEIFRYGTGHGSGLTRSMMAWTEGPSPMLLHLTEEQRKKWLTPLINGQKTACIGITEPDAGSDISNIQTTAIKDGDEWILNGRKQYITNAVFADTAQILAKTDQGKGIDSMAMFLVDTDNPGFEVGPMNLNLMMDGITANLKLTDCRVSEHQIVGEIGHGLPLALSWINWRRACRPGMCVGMGRYLLDRMLTRATKRRTFGEPIGTNQAIQWPIVETATELQATRNMAIRMLAEIDNYTTLDQLNQPPEILRRMCMLKYYPENQLFEWADRAIQVLGGLGLMRDGGVERVFRVARNLRIPAGTTEIQKRTIAKTLGLTDT